MTSSESFRVTLGSSFLRSRDCPHYKVAFSRRRNIRGARIRTTLENYKFGKYICTRDEALPVGNMMRVPLTSHWSSSGIWSFCWKLAVIILVAAIVIQVLFS